VLTLLVHLYVAEKQLSRWKNTQTTFVPYATSKAGIEMMTKTMALELAKDNIRANLVAPGAIETNE
jgi:NAD(P)-dependent dehydrogenase (short-subunit alcohol dehydrogenase family)